MTLHQKHVAPLRRSYMDIQKQQLTKSEISSLGNMIAINEILNNETPETIKTKKEN
jgi:hypothetical protein